MQQFRRLDGDGMNPNYTTTVTIYNRLKARDSQNKKDTWWRRVIPDCSWVGKSGIQQKERTDETAKDIYVVRIPENEEYRAYSEWINNPSLYFTLNEGDIIVKGVCDDEITGESPFTASEFVTAHKNAHRITVVKDNTDFRFGKHYKVSGGLNGNTI